MDARTDLFSFGAVLYEMATGALPVRGESTGMVFDSILNRAPLAAVRLNPDLPPKLEEIINKALEKNRNLRYQHASEMGTDLQRLKRDTESARIPTASRAEASPHLRMHWKVTLSVGLAVVALAVGSYFYPHRPPKLSDKDTIVLADFSNSTGDPVFDDTLKTALSVSLNQSPFLNVLSDSSVSKTLKLMEKPPDTKLTPDVARELCQRAGSKAYIAGSIASLGSQYVVGLKVVNCQSGDKLAQEQVRAPSKEKVLDALGEAASKLRSELGESLASVQKFDVPLEQATTSSLEALNALSLAFKAAREKGVAASLPYALRSIELDPSFSSGYRMVGDMYYSRREGDRARPYLTKAFQLREHASEREKLNIAGDYFLIETRDLDKAVRTFQELGENYPKDSYLGLGSAYYQQGQHQKAADVLRQAVRLSPNDVFTYEDLARQHVRLSHSFYECMPSCAQRVLDTADIVRDGDFRQTQRPANPPPRASSPLP